MQDHSKHSEIHRLNPGNRHVPLIYKNLWRKFIISFHLRKLYSLKEFAVFFHFIRNKYKRFDMINSCKTTHFKFSSLTMTMDSVGKDFSLSLVQHLEPQLEKLHVGGYQEDGSKIHLKIYAFICVSHVQYLDWNDSKFSFIWDYQPKHIQMCVVVVAVVVSCNLGFPVSGSQQLIKIPRERLCSLSARVPGWKLHGLL